LLTSTDSPRNATLALRAGGLVRFGRRHRLFLALITGGLVARIVVTLAYQPAILFFDSLTYLANARDLVPPQVRPLGYGAFLHLVIGIGHLAAVPVVQHAIGLGIGVLIYALLLRLRVRRWLAALAAAPVLFDGFQLSLEQYVLSESLFELLIVAACVLLLWRRKPSVALAAGAGALFALAALTRSVGLVVLGPALVVAVLLTLPRPWPALALLAAFALPVAGYATWFHSKHGKYGITALGGQMLYARVAPFADCTKLTLTAQERVLCPREPLGQRMPVKRYMWSPTRSPVFRIPAESRDRVARQFARHVIVQQPVAYTRTVLGDALHAFALTGSLAGDDGPGQWRFRAQYPVFRPDVITALHRYGYRHGVVRVRLARALRSYQQVVFVHGPLFAAAFLAALLAVLGVGRARRSGLRAATLLFAGLGLVLLLAPAASHDFTFRYRIPLVVLLPPAAALAVAAFMRHSETDGSVR
jgi:hypothetical protein